MKRENKIWLYPFILIGLVLIVTSGCSEFDQLASSPLVKVKCRENKVTKSLHKTESENKDSSQKNDRKLFIGFESSVRPIIICITSDSPVKRLVDINIQNQKSTKLSSSKNSISRNITTTFGFKSSSIRHYAQCKTTNGDGETIFGTLALLFLLLAILCLIMAFALATNSGWFFPTPNGTLLILALLSSIVSFILSIAGLSSYDNTQRNLSIVVFVIWMVILLLILLLMI